MNLKEAAKILHDAGAKDSHENLQLSAKHGSLTNAQYNALRTNRHMEAALGSLLEDVYAEGWLDGVSADARDSMLNPYSEQTL